MQLNVLDDLAEAMKALDGKKIRDDQIASEHDLQQVLIDMVPTPGKSNEEGGSII
jgi:hypothetical protein